MSTQASSAESDDHDHAQPDEQDRGVRHLVAAALDRAEHPAISPLAVLGRGGGRSLLAHVRRPCRRPPAKRPKNSASASTAFSNSSSSTRSFGRVDVREAVGRAEEQDLGVRHGLGSALTSGIEPPVATTTVSLPQALQAARAAAYAGRTWSAENPCRSRRVRPRAGSRRAASPRGGGSSAACASPASCSGWTRRLILARAWGRQR